MKSSLRNLLELKTLFVINSSKNSGRGIGSRLVSKCEEDARSLRAEGIVVTVSEEKPESLGFFKKKGFAIVEEYPGRYKNGLTEYALAKLL